MILGILGTSLLGNMLAGKRINRLEEGIIRVGYGSEGYPIKNKDF